MQAAFLCAIGYNSSHGKFFIFFIAGAEPRTIGCRYLAARTRFGAGRCRQRQNPRAHHPHCLAVAKRAGQYSQRAGGYLYQQGRQGNAAAPWRHVADTGAHHVAGHVSRPVSPLFAPALPRCRSAGGISNLRQRRPIVAHQTPAQKPEYPRRKHCPAQLARLYQCAKRSRIACRQPRRSRPTHATAD